ncbi:MAG: TRAP-type transport system periplasmic protein [Solirubrobacteraceae bacterium]|nr:TRAP-type transport system periplasmic protein [Solirubrobacteraceae bacterium]
MSRHHVALVSSAALLGLTASGCFGGSSGRAGGAIKSKTAVLTIASHEPRANLTDWINAVQRLSHGSLRIKVSNNWRSSQADYEKATIADVRARKVDLASIPARAYDTVGVNSFQGLLAPFLIDNYALQRKVLAGDLPDKILAGVKPLGVVGVGLLPGPLQSILSIGTPMLGPFDFRGQPIAIEPSKLAGSTFRALGTTTNAPPSGSGDDNIRRNGLELDLVAIVANRANQITADETLTSNVMFWPRVTSVVVNDKTYAALSAQQRRALTNAARVALAPATQRLVRDEHQALGVICSSGAAHPHGFEFLAAPPTDLAALRRTVEPVYQQLQQDPVTSSVIAAADTLKRHITRPRSPACPGAPRRQRVPDATGGHLAVDANLTADHDTWTGPVTSKQLGRGRLDFTQHLKRRTVLFRRKIRLEAHFAAGTLHACVMVAIAPGARHDLVWNGPGVITTASRALRRYVGHSLRFAATTTPGNPSHLHGGFITDAPSGFHC